MGKIELYTYREICELMNVSIDTVRDWRRKGVFRIAGYRRVPHRHRKEAVVTGDEVRRILAAKLLSPSLFDHNFDWRKDKRYIRHVKG